MNPKLRVILIGVVVILVGAYWTLAGSKGAPRADDLKRVDGRIDEVVIWVKDNAIGQEVRRFTTIKLADGKGSYKYYDDQPRSESLRQYLPGEPVSLLIDDRFTTGDGMFEIWELKRGDHTLSTYADNLKNYPGSGAQMVMGLIVIAVGVLIIKQNL
ncbi:MAG: hypothetical protein GC159_23910 [Phycisphaera sp.]|nr:hypothetical protein [Phycisphaera sp.]